MKIQHFDSGLNSNWCAVEGFAQRLKRENVSIPDIHFT